MRHIKYYKMLIKEMENYKILSEESVSDRQFHEGMTTMADKVAVRFKLEFAEEMRKEGK